MHQSLTTSRQWHYRDATPVTDIKIIKEQLLIDMKSLRVTGVRPESIHMHEEVQKCLTRNSEVANVLGGPDLGGPKPGGLLPVNFEGMTVKPLLKDQSPDSVVIISTKFTANSSSNNRFTYSIRKVVPLELVPVTEEKQEQLAPAAQASAPPKEQPKAYTK